MKLLFIIALFFSSICAQDPILISGRASQELTGAVAKHLGVEVCKANIETFNDGELSIRIEENIRNRPVFVVQSTCATKEAGVNESLMELYLLIRTLKRASAQSVTAVIPYFGYARQDRKTSPRVPLSASDVAMLLETAGADRVIAIDLHCGQIQGFFHKAPVDNLYAATALAPYFAAKKLHNVVVVSPDAGGVERARAFRERLESKEMPLALAVIIKHRARAGVIETMDLVGDVQGADAIIVDDLVDTGGTLIRAAELLKKRGAARVFVAATHPVFSKDALAKIGQSKIDELVITDTIPLRGDVPSNITMISVAPLLAEAIRRIDTGESVSGLFL